MIRKYKLMALILVLVTSFMLYSFSTKGYSSEKAIYAYVTVAPGDTIWDIARYHQNKGDDLRKLVYEIRQLNKLNSAIIQPGQELKIPINNYND